MNELGYVLVVLFGISAIVAICQIGLPREPMTKGLAAIIVCANAILITAVCVFGTGHF